MGQIKAKVYYKILTGEILTITGEMQGSSEETTKEQDIKIDEQLKDKKDEEVDLVELEYGTLANTFNNSESYNIDIGTKKLEVTYFTQKKINDMQQYSCYYY